MIKAIEGVIMGMRMDKYNDQTEIPTRSDKNQELYKQIYNAYDEFENLVVPSNAREITMSDLKKEIVSRKEYHEKKDYEGLINKKSIDEETPKEKKSMHEEQVYDIRELLSKAVSEHDSVKDDVGILANGDYLKKIKIDSRKTNIEQVKEIYEDTLEEELSNDDESLLKTANLSLEILSDLKSDNDKTIVEAPIKSNELPTDIKESDFYSSKYKFSKRDFEGKDDFADVKDEDTDDGDDNTFEEDRSGYKKFIKVLLLVFGILLVIILLIYIFNLFNKV